MQTLSLSALPLARSLAVKSDNHCLVVVRATVAGNRRVTCDGVSRDVFGADETLALDVIASAEMSVRALRACALRAVCEQFACGESAVLALELVAGYYSPALAD